MEVIVQRAELLRELSLSQRIVEKRNTIPILANILLEADKEGLSLTATDLEVGLRCRCRAEVRQPGALTVPAKKLFEVVRSLGDDEVRIRAGEGASLTLQCGRAQFRLVGLDAKDYPNLPMCEFSNAWEAPGEVFQGLLGKVIFAVTADESRFPIAGVLFLGSKKHVSVVATDGHRLAIAELDRGLKGLTAETRLVMPKKALLEVKQVGDLGEARIACEVKDNHIYFSIGERLLVARMVEDQFPAYEKVIPKGNDKRINVARVALEGAVRRVAVLSQEKARTVRLQFLPGQLVISASNPEMGEAREEMTIDYQGEEFEIAFNAQYILDFLAVVETEQVRLDLKDGSTQVIMHPVLASGGDEEGGKEAAKQADHYYVLMPMRL